MLDFLDDERLRVGNILGRDTSREGQESQVKEEKALHVVRLGKEVEQHGTPEEVTDGDRVGMKTAVLLDVDEGSSMRGCMRGMREYQGQENEFETGSKTAYRIDFDQ